MRKHTIPLTLILVFALIGTKALFHTSLFSAHDIWHQVARFYHYQKAVSEGQYPPYWIGTLAHGLGYPLFFFSYHLPWIIGLPILWISNSIPISLKTLFVISYLLSGIFMYIFAFNLLKNKLASLLSSLLYLWAPYRFVTIFVYGSIGTAFIFTFLPLLFLGILKTSNNKTTRSGIILTAVGLSTLLLSHLMTTLSIIPILFLFILSSQKTNKAATGKGLLLGIGLSAFYLIPAVYYSKFTQVSTGAFDNLYQHGFANFSQLIYSKWGYGIYKESIKEGAFSLQIGIAQWLTVLSSVLVVTWFLLFKEFKKLKTTFTFLVNESIYKKFTPLILSSLVGFALSIFAILDYSHPAWDLLSKVITLDSPTMFMLPATFTASILSGTLYVITNKKLKILLFTSLLAIAFYTNRNHLRVNMYTSFSVPDYVAAETTTNSFHEYLPLTANLNLIYGPQVPLIEPENIKPEKIIRNTNLLAFSFSAPEKTTVTIKHLVFPGIVLYEDEQKKAFTKEKSGRIQFETQAGQHNIVVKFEETFLIKISKLTSIFSILALLFLWRKNHAKT
ncbi:MAG: hypothetical protein HYU80_01715 [Candidatus Blackburnbacteria bacterium]|nr:hypothetical protein [Candidatus Blackburnbacteria bacterium]